jgi:hypothetical protein
MKKLAFIALLFLTSCYKDGLSTCDSLHSRMEASNQRIELAKTMAENGEISNEEAKRRIQLEQEAIASYRETLKRNGCL